MIFGSILSAVGGLATAYLENLLLWSIPLVLSFTGEVGVSIVMRGFEALAQAPTFYTASLGIMVGASFGVKSAAKLFKK